LKPAVQRRPVIAGQANFMLILAGLRVVSLAAVAYESFFIACDGYQADFLRIENVLTYSVCHPQG
jgi:hypothetical protein